ncbi:hypothetical protein K488DRAFT_82176 [Vararia minispora EC-137]|uniref:Uncharacterized protein n=1 Tax=Vararia minispora EC-137 TaxID=1314806 RepID=A0ACB8QXW4_9AGAM|nr:hypothetical protein K488DRAFT_82176 [Vararia minispora EC-137]
MPTELELLRTTLTNLQYMIVGVIVNGILLGAYTLLISLSSAILVSKGLGTRSRALQFGATLIMYSACVIYFSAYASPLLRQIFEPDKYTLVSGHAINVEERLLTGSMAVAFWVGDAIVLWRTTVIWGPSHIVRGISCLLYLNFVIVGSVDLANLELYPPSSIGNPNYPSELPSLRERWSWAALMSSFAINVYSLVLVTYRTWRAVIVSVDCVFHTKPSYQGPSQGVETVYTAAAVAANRRHSLVPFFVTTSGILIEAAGIYPTLLVVVARLLNETIRKEESYSSWALRPAAGMPSRNPIGIEFVRTTRISESGSAVAQSQHATSKYDVELRA